MPTKRVSDAALHVKARRVIEIEQEIDALIQQKGAIQQTILGEMTRRDTKVLENGGLRLTSVVAQRVVYDQSGLTSALTPRQRKMCERTIMDNKMLESAVQSGAIDPRLVAEYSEVKANKPYLKVTPSR